MKPFCSFADGSTQKVQKNSRLKNDKLVHSERARTEPDPMQRLLCLT